MSCFDNANEREFLENVQLAAVPQQTFSKADDYFMRANTLDDEAAELEKKLDEIKKSAEDFRMTAFDLRRLAAHDRAHIQAELDKVLDEYADTMSLFGSNPDREKKIQDLLMAVEDGTVLPGAINDVAKDLSSFRSTHQAKKNRGVEAQLLLTSSDATVKRERESSSGDESNPNKVRKKAKLDEIDEEINRDADEMSIAGSCSADEADEEKDSDDESVILGSPMKPIPIVYMAAGRKNKMMEIERDSDPEPASSSPYSERIVPLKKSKKNKHNRLQPQVYRETAGPQILDDDLPVVRSTDLTDIPIIHNPEDLQAEKKKKSKRQRSKSKRESGNFEKEANLADLEMKRRVSFANTTNADSSKDKDRDAKRRHSLKAQKQKCYDI